MTRPPAPARAITVRGARTHNLRNVTASFPVGALTVVTGPSGSGKSSLAFDTLYAEGQRRFVESMSTYVRQFLERMERPDVDGIDHLMPALAVEQRAPARSARSTIGTATEIHDVLRLLFATAGRIVCPDCHLEARRESPDSAAERLLETLGEGARLLVVAPRPAADLERTVPEWLRSGFFRALGTDGVTEFSIEAPPVPGPDGRVRLVVGRHVLRRGDPELTRSLETAFDLGGGELETVPSEGGPTLRFFRDLSCGNCGRRFAAPTPALFSFNSPRGACETCQGFGRIAGIDVGKVIPHPWKSIEERPFAPFNSPAYESAYDELAAACRTYRIRRRVPWNELREDEREAVWNGRGDWYGVTGLFDWLEKKRYKVHVRVFLSRYRGYTTCPSCLGARLNPSALSVTVGGRTIAGMTELRISEFRAFLAALPLSAVERERSASLLPELCRRAETLDAIGLGYLTLSRPMRTLSGGEAQRVQLASAIGNSLTGTLYVLDEPTVGLHPRDTARLLGVLRRLAAAGNAVAVVEHDLDVIRAADHVIDLGPGAGDGGGVLLFEGSPRALLSAATKTGDALRRAAAAEGPDRQRGGTVAGRRRRVASRLDAAGVTIVGARAFNLRDVTVAIPAGKLVSVCGLSGSGKSSLVVDVLAAGAARALGRTLPGDGVGAHERIDGLDAFTDVVLVDQSPLGRSARSNPATYTKAWDTIRELFARTPRAKERGLSKGSFSFNAPSEKGGGRCETCAGAGVVSIDMQFLADVTVVCETCDGRRFAPDVLSVRLRGRNVSELLGTTVDAARDLFHDVAGVVAALEPLAAAGLGYLTLGQSTSSLSGGEAQRLKIASFLRKGGAPGRTLFVFDEPTTGLHPADVDVLLAVLRRLLAAGHSVVVVEHHLGFLAASDHLIELGPGAGPDGGRVVFEGTPAALVANGATPTAEALRRSPIPPEALEA